MKILYLCADPGIPVLGQKGASVHVREMIAAFRRQGHSIVLAAPRLTQSRWDEPTLTAARILHLPPSRKFRFLTEYMTRLGADSRPWTGELRRISYDQTLASRLLRHFEDDPPDMIYERASLFSTAGVTAAAALKRPLLVELNAPLTLEQSLYRSLIHSDLAIRAEQYVLRNAQAVLAVSDALGEYALSQGASPERIHVVPNGVDPEAFCPGPRRPDVRKKRGLGEGPIVGFVGGLRPWHGVQILPALLARLPPNVQMLIVGDGPMRAELESQFSQLHLNHRVTITGLVPHDQVPELIREFDVALVPYGRPEHRFYFSPLKLFECLACGVPVVAASLEQIPKIIEDGRTGLLYPPGDVEALRRACERLLAEPSLARKLGQAGAEMTRSKYTWDQNARRAVELASR